MSELTLIDVVQERVGEDSFRYRATDLSTGELVEVTYSLDELASLERGEEVPAQEIRVPLADALAAARANGDRLERRKAELRRLHPGIGD